MPATFTPENPLRVAIVGGGIGGLCATIALLKHPHIDVQVYEAASTFGEIGAGVGLGPNAQHALDLVGPGARAAFDKHASGNMWPKYATSQLCYLVGEGEHEGELIYDQRNLTGQQSVHRAHFLDELVKSVPMERAHFNKRVASLEKQRDDSVLLCFKDGTTAVADAVIGADGVHSRVRAHLLGEELAKPVFAGSAAYRALVPMEKAVERLGEEYAGQTFMMCGKDKAILSYPIDGGKTSNMVAFDFSYETWDHDEWVIPADADSLRNKFRSWGANARSVVDFILSTESPKLWALWDDPPASTYTHGPIVIMGDAAHATTPFQAQGAGQAIEDAAVLGSLLAEVSAPHMIESAFLAYDAVRRVRTQRVVSTSRETGQLISGNAEGVGDDLEKMREALSYRGHWIWNRNMVEQNREARELMRESL